MLSTVESFDHVRKRMSRPKTVCWLAVADAATSASSAAGQCEGLVVLKIQKIEYD